jgi:hypothetical protein
VSLTAAAILAALLRAGGDAAASPGGELPVAQPKIELDVAPSIGLGDTVEVTLRVRNDGPDPIDLELPGRPVAFDVVVVGPDGAEVWRRLGDAVSPSILMLLRLGPGETRDFTATWAQRDKAGRPVPPGRYTVYAVLPLPTGRLTTARRELVIKP